MYTDDYAYMLMHQPHHRLSKLTMKNSMHHLNHFNYILYYVLWLVVDVHQVNVICPLWRSHGSWVSLYHSDPKTINLEE